MPEARLHSRSKLGRTHAHWKRKQRRTFSALIFWRSQRHTEKKHKLFAWASVPTFSFRVAGVLFSLSFLFFRGMNVMPVRLSVQGRCPKTLSFIVFSVLFCFAASLGMVMVRLPVSRCWAGETRWLLETPWQCSRVVFKKTSFLFLLKKKLTKTHVFLFYSAQIRQRLSGPFSTSPARLLWFVSCLYVSPFAVVEPTGYVLFGTGRVPAHAWWFHWGRQAHGLAAVHSFFAIFSSKDAAGAVRYGAAVFRFTILVQCNAGNLAFLEISRFFEW